MINVRRTMWRAAVALLVLGIGVAAVLGWQKWREPPLEERYQLEAVTSLVVHRGQPITELLDRRHGELEELGQEVRRDRI